MKYSISEKRLKYLIKEIVRSLQIPGLYRIQIEFHDPSKEEAFGTKATVALFFEVTFPSYEIHDIKNEIEDLIKAHLNLDTLVLPIPYSEVKYHLRKPRNV